MGNEDLFSIITINYNDALGLKKTFESVSSQTFQEIEYIIIDGGSTDGSLDIIKANSKKISYWISEKDNGVYHAMNKGIAKAKGKYLIFLNSGDYLVEPLTIERCNIFIKDNPDIEIFYGNLYLTYDNENLIKKEYPNKLTFNYFFQGESLPHPASFIKRSLFFKVGFYNEKLKIISDWEFWLKAIFIHQATYKNISVPISVFNMNGISSNGSNFHIIRSEKEHVYEEYFSGIIDDYIELKSFDTDKRICVLKQLEQYPILSKIVTSSLLMLSWIIRNIRK